MQFPNVEIKAEICPWAFQQPKTNQRNEKFILAMKRKHTKTYQKKTPEERLFPSSWVERPFPHVHSYGRCPGHVGLTSSLRVSPSGHKYWSWSQKTHAWVTVPVRWSWDSHLPLIKVAKHTVQRAWKLRWEKGRSQNAVRRQGDLKSCFLYHCLSLPCHKGRVCPHSSQRSPRRVLYIWIQNQ